MSGEYESAREALADRDAFADWLQAHADEVVGVPGLACGCPLSAWLSEVLGGEWVVTPLYCGESAGWERWPLPDWARAFVEAVDRRCQWMGLVSGALALEVLWAVV